VDVNKQGYPINPLLSNTYDEIKSVMVDYYKAKSGILRICFTYPYSTEKSRIENNDVILILTKESCPELLKKEHWDFLESLKIGRKYDGENDFGF